MILITEYVDQSALRWLQDRVACHYDPDLGLQPAKLMRFVGQASAWIVRNKTKVSSDLLAAAERLQVVGRLGVGLDNLDLAALGERRVTTVYSPGANANAVAELCILFMLAQARRLLQADQSVRAGAWARQEFSGQELWGKTVGIIGLGAVGKRLAELSLALGCRVLVNTVGSTYGMQQVPLRMLLALSDFVSINVPLTEDTRGLIGEAELELLQPHAYIINTARGEVLNEAALYQALLEQRIAGAALDVRVHEPPGKNDPFFQLPNVILTPHLAGWTAEAQTAVCQMVVEDVWRVLEGAQPRFPVPGLNFVSQAAVLSVGE
jgi:D-3-phosphoglycerate dehydrogenase/(S)-sulfolactate dehydrogenase